MQKRIVYIVVAVIALAVFGGAAVWYFVKPEPQTTRRGYQEIPPPARDNMAPPKKHFPIPELSEEEWPYERPAEHLYIQKGITLDPNVVTINHELKDVSLCGTTYKTKQVIIDGVDVVQRVAELFSEASATTSAEVCPYLMASKDGMEKFGGYIGEGAELRIVIHEEGPRNPEYVVSLSITKSLYNANREWHLGLESRVSIVRNSIRFGHMYNPYRSITAALHE